jgi:phospho-N-acetylmuramoyl-pentapeptide-transferase
MLATLGFGAVGFADDYLKIVRQNHRGLIPRYKMGLLVLIGLGVGVALMALAQNGLYNTRLIFPFFKNLIPDLGWFYVAFASLVLVCATNAVTLTGDVALNTGVLESADGSRSATHVWGGVRSGKTPHPYRHRVW